MGSFVVQALLASITAAVDSVLSSCSFGQGAVQCSSPAGLAGESRHPRSVPVPDCVVLEGCCCSWEHAAPADKRCGRAAATTIQCRP